MTDYYAYTIPGLVKLLGARFKDYRLQCNMTQKDVSDQSGLTVATIHKFESGTANNISLGTFLRLLRTIEQLENIDDLLPDVGDDPYLYKNENKIQRIRH